MVGLLLLECRVSFIMLRPLLVSVVYESNDEFTLFGFIEGPGLSSTSPELIIISVTMYKQTRTEYINEREARIIEKRQQTKTQEE